MPSPGKAWAVGDFINGKFQQQTLIEHFNGTVWSVVPSPSPGAKQNILYGVAAITDSDVWAVGAFEDANDVWHTLAEHWNGTAWSVVNTVDAGANGNQLFAVKALATNNVYAAGQQAGRPALDSPASRSSSTGMELPGKFFRRSTPNPKPSGLQATATHAL